MLHVHPVMFDMKLTHNKINEQKIINDKIYLLSYWKNYHSKLNEELITF